MSFLSITLAVLASVVIGSFVLGMSLGFLLGRHYEDHGPGDPPLLERDE
ncbi:MAG: hypothetical protein ACEQSB_06195 [Undibacterium sp.]